MSGRTHKEVLAEISAIQEVFCTDSRDTTKVRHEFRHPSRLSFPHDSEIPIEVQEYLGVSDGFTIFLIETSFCTQDACFVFAGAEQLTVLADLFEEGLRLNWEISREDWVGTKYGSSAGPTAVAARFFPFARVGGGNSLITVDKETRVGEPGRVVRLDSEVYSAGGPPDSAAAEYTWSSLLELCEWILGNHRDLVYDLKLGYGP